MQTDYGSIVRVGADLAKAVVQVHAVDAGGVVIVASQIRRDAFVQWCNRLPTGCVIAMEACSAAHHLARELVVAGLSPRLIAPFFVFPYRMQGKTGKSDANDAAAICEAASRPQMRFVSPKTLEQQSWLAVHRLRDGFVRDRRACMNRTRGILFEFGITFPLSIHSFRKFLPKLLQKEEAIVPAIAKEAVQRCLIQFVALEQQVEWCDQQIAKHVKGDPLAQRALEVLGVGPIGASALVATLGDLSQFKTGHHLSSWLGLVPRQHSTGGKQRLGRITKRGDPYLRKLLVLGAKSALAVASNRHDPVSAWASQLRARVGWPKAVVALANRNARILWRVLAKQALPAEETSSTGKINRTAS